MNKLCLLAGLYNFAIIPFWFLTDISKYNPFTFSNVGLMNILLWGLAYMCLSCVKKLNRTIINLSPFYFLFVLEKMVYASDWLYWLRYSYTEEIFHNDFFGGLLMVSYGFGDLMFAMLFLKQFILKS